MDQQGTTGKRAVPTRVDPVFASSLTQLYRDSSDRDKKPSRAMADVSEGASPCHKDEHCLAAFFQGVARLYVSSRPRYNLMKASDSLNCDRLEATLTVVASRESFGRRRPRCTRDAEGRMRGQGAQEK